MALRAQSEFPTGLDEPLTEIEYVRLGAILDGLPGEDVMGAEEMDGLFAALICGPVTVPPSVYLEEIWGGGQAPFANDEDFGEFLNLAMRHWNSMSRMLATRDEIFEPLLFVKDDEELPRGNSWADGFSRGMRLSHPAWEEIFNDEDRLAMLVPILALHHEHNPDPKMRSWTTPPDRELREKLLVNLSVSTMKLYEYFRPHRKLATTPRRTAGKPQVGRNDACPCGSGKKYKRCCGGISVQ